MICRKSQRPAAKAIRISSEKFRAPVFIGETIHVELKVRESRAMPRLGGGLVTFDVRVVKQEGTVAQRGDWSLLFKRRPT